MLLSLAKHDTNGLGNLAREALVIKLNAGSFNPANPNLNLSHAKTLLPYGGLLARAAQQYIQRNNSKLSINPFKTLFQSLSNVTWTNKQQIKKHLYAWVKEGENSERDERILVMDEIMSSNPTLDTNKKICIPGDLNLRTLPSLSTLPTGLRINGCLNLERCTNMTELPLGTEVNSLHIAGCHNLHRSFENVIIHGSIIR